MLSGTLLVVLLFSSCKEQKGKAGADMAKTNTTANKDVYYTCSMHPQVHEELPGNCPICGMKLIAVPKTSASNNMQIHLSEEQIKLGNIQTDTVGKGNIGEQMVLTGTLNFNQDKLSTVSARVEGRIEKLYFKTTGDYVVKGAKLYDLYSEQLNNAKQEYVHVIEQESVMGNSLINYEALMESAKNKLLLWGMTEGQVVDLARTKQASSLTTFYSTEVGFITTINVNEGEYVMEGGPIVQLANLSTIWAEAQVYTTQMAFINESENVSVQIPDLNKTINGTITFINPEINPETRINLVRVTIPNKDNQLHPGMPAYIIVNNKKRNAITLAADAVLRDSKGATVWVQTASGVYEVRMVKTGMTENNAVEITSGISAGDVVVTSGAYLLNSEYIFEHGSDPMAGMKM
ncbi:efflux RND transporter periplasmic adaptor subunit [Ilyomonas limi]|uniref:Efflux RND transporter periplasmic adaptor subunit n=2 Tax=Ilyomonas limi TaxID=2575867 RepID=A0A4U3KX42_9BACT|nr:efflux RND transporter periplasmic adaptor subunit [Ilyomonas limi]